MEISSDNNQTINNTQIAPGPIPPASNVSKKKIISIIVVLILVVVAGGLMFFLKNKQADVSQIQNSPNVQNVDTSTWQTFSNRFLDFKYPPEYKIKQRQDLEPRTMHLSFNSQDEKAWYGDADSLIKSENNVQDLESYVAGQKSSYIKLGDSISNERSFKIQERAVVEFDRQTAKNYGSEIYVDFDDYILRLRLWGQDRSLDTIHTVLQGMVLKDGKLPSALAPSSLDIVTWKDFDTSYISLKYPSDWKLESFPKEKGFEITSPDQKMKLSLLRLSPLSFSELNSTKENYLAIYKRLHEGDLQQNITINNLPATLYDETNVANSPSMTFVLLTTQNNVYDFSFVPSISNQYFSKILDTIKIKSF